MAVILDALWRPLPQVAAASHRAHRLRLSGCADRLVVARASVRPGGAPTSLVHQLAAAVGGPQGLSTSPHFAVLPPWQIQLPSNSSTPRYDDNCITTGGLQDVLQKDLRTH